MYTSDTTITQTLVSVSKCDSVVTIHIIIEKGLTSVPVSQIGSVLTTNVVADSYQWMDCNNSNAKIAGATSATFTVPVSGSFAVAVKVGLCVNVSSCQVIYITGIVNGGFDQMLQLSPNPASNSLMIDFGTAVGEAKIELINAFGQTVLKKSINNIATTELDLTVFADGVYMIHLIRDSKSLKRRIVVQK